MTPDRPRSMDLSLLLVTGVLLFISLVVGCNGKKTAVKPVMGGDRARLQAMYDTVITRLRNRDKSGLYDVEFEYIREQFSFAEYQAFPQIKTVEADTTDSFRIDSVHFFGAEGKRDSAEIYGTIVFRNFDDSVSYMPGQKHICYFHQGRWIRATVGVIQNQLAFDSLKNAATDAASKESGG